jgi:HIP---CoA ligase
VPDQRRSEVQPDVAEPRTIPEALDLAALRFGAEEAVVDGATRLSFRDLQSKVRLVSRALIASGIAAGDRVAIWAPNSADWVVISFAVYAVGGVLVPLNTRYKGEEAGHVLRTSRARLLFSVTDFLGSDLVAMLADVPELDALTETVVIDGPMAAGTIALVDFVHRATAVPRPPAR